MFSFCIPEDEKKIFEIRDRIFMGGKKISKIYSRRSCGMTHFSCTSIVCDGADVCRGGEGRGQAAVSQRRGRLPKVQRQRQRAGHQSVALPLLQWHRHGGSHLSPQFLIEVAHACVFLSTGVTAHGPFHDAKRVSALWRQGLHRNHALRSLPRFGSDQEEADDLCTGSGR